MTDQPLRFSPHGELENDPPLAFLTLELADGTIAVRLEDAQAAIRDAAHKAAQIGFTYGALGRDFTFAYKNVEDMLAAIPGSSDD